MSVQAKPLVIPVFIPHSGCPHQCAFCNQTLITGETGPLPGSGDIDDRIHDYLKYKGRRKRVELAFFGGNFLGLAPEIIRELLDTAATHVRAGRINGIRFSTRPDTITVETLSLVRAYPVSTVEIGVQSMNDEVLRECGRGHRAMDTVDALALLRDSPVRIGVQVMVGLPEDREATLMDSTRVIGSLKPDFARIYPLMVLRGSRMAQWFRQGRYRPLSLAEAVELVKKMVRIFRAHDVEVIRMGLQASDGMGDPSIVLAGPWHPAFGHLVLSGLLFDRVCEQIESGFSRPEKLVLRVHPRSVSRLRGNRNENMAKLALQYPSHQFRIQTDEAFPVDDVAVIGGL